MRSRIFSSVPLLVSSLIAGCAAHGPAESDEAAPQRSSPDVTGATQHDASPPLWLIPPAPRQDRADHEVKPIPRPFNTEAALRPDPVRQSRHISLLAPTILNSFDGVGNGFTGPAGTFTVNAAPPDTNGDVGPNHYVQTVNTDFAIFNKAGTALYGPVTINTLWSGFGGLCQNDNDGDPVVLYDPIADRWIISQFAVTGGNAQCVAVSQTADPTGSYYRYSFSYSAFPDYPKLGVWPDAYYVTFNMFSRNTFRGAQICAYDRTRMLGGLSATQQCFTTSTSFGGLLPSDLDGAQQPPAGAPNYIVGLGASPNQLAYWTFHVDWTTPANTTLTGPTTLATAAYSEACNGGTCIPQAGTSQQLDSLADRVMFRLAYRNLGDHQALVLNHSITAGSVTGVRWYELRVGASANTLSIFQQGTYAPDALFRWMGSAAMDQAGNIALGYSVSSSSTRPGVHYTGRLAGDAAGTMTQGEGSLFEGGGSQLTNLSRWGDYSMLGVDPTDDCTFWVTNEYIPSNGTFNWKTRIGSFKLPGCPATPPPTNDFSIGANPTSLSIQQGQSGTSTISTTLTLGSTETITLSASGLPAGATASFNPASVTTGGSSTMTVTTASSTPTGSYSITVTGTAPSATHSTGVSLSVTPPPGSSPIVNGDFETGNLSGWTSTGTTSVVSTSHTGAWAAQVGSTSPGADSSIAQTFVAPANGGTLSFWYQVHCPDTITYDWASATLVDNTAGTTTTMLANTCTNTGTWVQASTSIAASAGGHSFTITLKNHDDNYPSDPTYTWYDDVVFTSNAPPSPDFTISATPPSQSVVAGNSTTYTATVAAQNGFTGTVTFSVGGLPAGATSSFNPASVAGSGSSTLTVSTASTTPAGSYPLTITGTSGSLAHNASVTLVVNTPPDFSISASPASQTVTQGASTTYSVSTSAASGSVAQTVTYSLTGLPGGASGSFNPTSATAGSGSTLTVSTASNTPAGSYTLTIGGAYPSPGPSHSTTVTLVVNVPPANPIVNGGFETGTFSGWTPSGVTAIVTSPVHSGSFAARVGSTSPGGDSSIAQTFTAPAAGGTLSFWYQVVCPDTVTYDWATATLRDNTTGTTQTILPQTCTNTGTWVQVSTSLAGTGGHSLTLTLANHDDNWPTDPTYTIYDDVSVQ